IERNALAQAQIVEDLLDVSRVIRGSLRLKLENVDLRAVIDAALATVRPAVEAKGIVLGVHLEALGLIVGDAGRLQQVVWNLVSNATKFTPTGGRIDVYLKRHDAEIELRVRDTGAGISPRFLPHVFERFRQGDSTATRSFGGLGLGLSIVRHLVELHGGTVEADSAGSGQGATFTVRLPLRVPEVAWQPPPAVAEDPVPSGEGALAGVDVLVVDDEPDARELVATILRQQGAAVRTVASAQAARDSLAHFRPRVLIADVAMPGEDGYTLIRGLRNDCVDLPAVALTAYARPEDRRRALDAGFEMHLAKPVEPDELVGVVADLSGRRA
ncbi:MAG: ATP-binding protein, partial [Bacteroidales bacterium]